MTGQRPPIDPIGPLRGPIRGLGEISTGPGQGGGAAPRGRPLRRSAPGEADAEAEEPVDRVSIQEPRSAPRKGQSRAMQVTLEVLGGPWDGKIFTFSRSSDIGRDDTADISIPLDKFISRRHARILVAEPECFLDDLGSTNGTVFEGRRLTRRGILSPGDLFKVGHTWVEINWQA